jgi:hypothetical protein
MKISTIQRAIDAAGGRFMLCSIAALRVAELRRTPGDRKYVAAITELAGGRLPGALVPMRPEPPLPARDEELAYCSMIFELDAEVHWPNERASISDQGDVTVRVRLIKTGAARETGPFSVPFDFIATGSPHVRWLGEQSTRLVFSPATGASSLPIVFPFALTEPGEAHLTVDCFSRRQWVRSVGQRFAVVPFEHDTFRDADQESEFDHAEVEERSIRARILEH